MKTLKTFFRDHDCYTLLLIFLSTASGCTGQIPGSFRFLQQSETFSSQQAVNTKIDLLWVVDNSSSMDVQQEKLRQGFQGFAQNYMKPTWDIRVAVITTDTYIAHPSFQSYLNRQINGSVGFQSTYIKSRLSTFVNPNWDPSMVNLTTGAMDNGITYNDLIPTWGPNYSRLLPGIHDGPITALCFEGMPFFINGAANCKVRDNQLLYQGTDGCTSSTGQNGLSQCINTVENNTVRSGSAIISTIPPAGTAPDSLWTQKLLNQFLVNVSTGSSGSGSERGLSSVLQLLQDNESTSTAFFRPGSLRGIIFISDEDDQSMVIPSPAPSGYAPNIGYACDQAGLIAVNGSSSISGVGGYCCNTSGNHCLFGDVGLTCSPKTVDGFTYTLGICVDQTQLIPVQTVKNSLDQFFLNLDGTSATTPNYFIGSIVALTGSSIQSIQKARDASALSAGVVRVVEADRGDRYLQLGTLVGAQSLSLDINSDDYSPILDQIGAQILKSISTFTLSRPPTGQEDMLVTVLHQDGTTTPVPNSDYIISGNQMVITNSDFVLSLVSTDQVNINYQPKTALGQ